MNMENKIKQIIVMRNDLNMRKGKMIAQGAHASMKFLIEALRRCYLSIHDDYDLNGHSLGHILRCKQMTSEQEDWLFGGKFTKIVAQVGSEQELMDVYDKASAAGLEVHLIEDEGLTEFHGQKTKTCLAIGPDLSSNIDPITGGLKLL